MDTDFYPGEMKDPDTHSPAYLWAKQTRIERFKQRIDQLIERLKEIKQEETKPANI
jgi:hypothetical protein